MRTAPSFRLEAATSRVWRRVLLGTWLATGAGIAGWLVTAWLWHDLDGPRGITAALATAAWLLARPTDPPLRITLAWDGHGWMGHVEHAEPRPCAVTVAIDLDTWLLLRLRPLSAKPSRQQRVHWIALAESNVGPPWHGLRCALYSARRMTDPAPSLTTPPPTDDRPLPR